MTGVAETKEKNKRRNKLVRAAKSVSQIFHPIYLPLLAFLALFFFTYLSRLPLQLQIYLITVIWVFTVLLPRFGITVYKMIRKWDSRTLNERKHRFVPFVIVLLSYVALRLVFNFFGTPWYMNSVLSTAINLMLLIIVMNFFIKVSTHVVGWSGFAGGLTAFSLLNGIDTTFWVCLVVIICGIVGTARNIVRQHSLTEVGFSAFFGFCCGMVTVLYL